MNILVTGGAGFIGSHVVDLMIKLGHDVVIIDNLSNSSKAFVNPKAVFFNKDIRKNLDDVFSSKRFDCLVHCAAQISVTESIDDPKFNNDVNINGSLNLLSYFRRYKLKRFIFLSSGSAVYGSLKYIPADENHPTKPLNPYGNSKLEFEKILAEHAEKNSFEYIVLRLPNIYGPRQSVSGAVIPAFITTLLRGGSPTIFGSGLVTRDFLYVSDVVGAIEKALHAKPQSRVFNIGSEEEITIIDLFNTIKQLIDSKISAKRAEERENEVERASLDCSLAKKELKWQKKYSLKQGLNETITWFKGQSQVM